MKRKPGRPKGSRNKVKQFVDDSPTCEELKRTRVFVNELFEAKEKLKKIRKILA